MARRSFRERGEMKENKKGLAFPIAARKAALFDRADAFLETQRGPAARASAVGLETRRLWPTPFVCVYFG